MDVNIVARIDGNMGKTLWAKQLNITLNFGIKQMLIDLKWDLIDNIWALISLRTGNDYRNAVVKYGKDGNTINLFVVGKMNDSRNYVLYMVEAKQISLTSGNAKYNKIIISCFVEILSLAIFIFRF